MDFLQYSEKLDSLQYFIRSGAAVTARELSAKLGVSTRTVFRMVDTLRLKGVDVIYCKAKKKYKL